MATPLTRRDFLKLSGSAAAAAALAACAPGQASTPRVPSGPTVNAPVTPQPVSGPLPPLGLIVNNRLAFGPRPGDLEEFESLGASDDERLRAYVAQQLDPASVADSDFEVRYEAAKFETLHKTLEELAYDHIVNNPYDPNDDEHWQWYNQPVDELIQSTILRAIYSRRQLSEVLADFWHNHFNVYGWQDDVTPLFVSYDRDVIRGNMLGNFRQMLEAAASHPSMLFYLNNNTNSDAGPNENYARELFELHTLGAENYLGVLDPNTAPRLENGVSTGYVDNDVYEAARCFTGWRVDDDLWDGEDDVGQTMTFLYYKPWHDRFNKIVLGQYIPADQPDMKDGRDVLDLLAAHPGTARYISRKLCRRLIADEPPESIVQAAADVFLANQSEPDQLKRVVETILLSDEFKNAWGQKMKRPLEVGAGILRALQADFTRLPGGVRWLFEMMGQPLFGHRPPDGYADKAEPWANTMSFLYRWNLLMGLTENWLNDEDTGETIRVDVFSQTPANLNTAESLADFWINRLLGRALPDESRQAVIEFMRQDYAASDELPSEHIGWVLPGMIEVILMSPEFLAR